MLRKVELAGFVAAARERKAEIEPVPTLSAWSPSGGPLSRACFEPLEARLLEGAARAHRASPLAGMCQHGAMGVDGVVDPSDQPAPRSRQDRPQGPPHPDRRRAR